MYVAKNTIKFNKKKDPYLAFLVIFCQCKKLNF